MPNTAAFITYASKLDRWIALDPLYTLSLTSILSLYKWKVSKTLPHLVVKRCSPTGARVRPPGHRDHPRLRVGPGLRARDDCWRPLPTSGRRLLQSTNNVHRSGSISFSNLGSFFLEEFSSPARIISCSVEIETKGKAKQRKVAKVKKCKFRHSPFSKKEM